MDYWLLINCSYVVGQHNIPALNEGVRGSCKGETRQIVAQTHDKSAAIAYLVHIQKVVKKHALARVVARTAGRTSGLVCADDDIDCEEEQEKLQRDAIEGEGSLSDPIKRPDVRLSPNTYIDTGDKSFAVSDTYDDNGDEINDSFEASRSYPALTRESLNEVRRQKDEDAQAARDVIERDTDLSSKIQEAKRIADDAALKAVVEEREAAFTTFDEYGERTPDDEI